MKPNKERYSIIKFKHMVANGRKKNMTIALGSDINTDKDAKKFSEFVINNASLCFFEILTDELNKYQKEKMQINRKRK